MNHELKDPTFWRGLIRGLLAVVVALGLFTAADAQFFELQLEAILGAVIALITAVTAILHYLQEPPSTPPAPPASGDGDALPSSPKPIEPPTHPLLGGVLLLTVWLAAGSMAQAQEPPKRDCCDCRRGEAGVCFFWRRPQEPKRDPEAERLREELRDLRAEVRGLRSEMMRPIYQLPPGGTPQQVLPPGGTPRQVLPDGGQPQQQLPPGGRILIELPGGGQPRQQIGGSPAPVTPQGTPGTPAPPGTPQQVLPGGGATPPITLGGSSFIRYSLYRQGEQR